ncbi:MAG: PKD domain-containing protein [Bacteroidota bacterium]|jgi:gliding motility-associated-like protein
MLFCSHFAAGQCTNVISSFPYNEGFENGPAWTSGVVSGIDNWAWGAPSRATINSAGGGVNAWCVGGLTGSGYASSAQCYLLSPCFDFSNLDFPWISFKIFWECERQWDGMVLQYSLNGTTWTNVGAFNDPVDCLNQNWYNYGNITWLNTIAVKHGWSGRAGATSGSCTGGFGSNGWVTASHCLSALAGQSNVRFRFLFGSGTSCNAYDGMALDDILISEAPLYNADFSFACAGQNTVAFTNLTNTCVSSFQWNFGDPASGSANTSTLQNPTHAFSSPGTYNVSLVATNTCGAPTSITVPVTIENVILNSTQISCQAAGDGSISVVTNGVGPYTYDWSPLVGTGSTIGNLSPGTYSVTVTPLGGCPINASSIITEPSLLTVAATSTPSVVCNNGQVSLSAAASGGTTGYVYEWSPGAVIGSTLTITPASGASYSVLVTDQNGCTATASTAFSVSPNLTVLMDADITEGCEPLCVSFNDNTLVSQPAGISSWLWDFGDGNFSQLQNPTHCFQSDDYSTTLTVTGVDGCVYTASTPILLDVWPTPVADFIYTPTKPDISNPEVRFTNLSSGSNQWLWSFGDLTNTVSNLENPSFTYSDTGTYVVSLVATSDLGCKDQFDQSLVVLPTLTFYIPNSFTPNGDGINDVFTPVSVGIESIGYVMQIYNRWGQLVFSSDNPIRGWDGSDFNSGNELPSGVYSWNIRFKDYDDNTQLQSGVVMLVR